MSNEQEKQSEPKSKPTKRRGRPRKNTAAKNVQEVNIVNISSDTSLRPYTKDEDRTLNGKISIEMKKGVGDVVEDVLNSPAVKPVTNLVKGLLWKEGQDCGCEKRKEKLNNLFRKKRTVRCLTEEHYSYLNAVLPMIKGQLEMKTMNELTRIHASVFNYHFQGACSTCSSRNKTIIEELKTLMEAYPK